MKLGAVLIAAGMGNTPMEPVGNSSVAQRMIASLQKAGVRLISVVTGPEERKLEKQLSQPGVVFLYNPTPEREDHSIHLGLSYLASKCSRVFLLKADRPLVAPETFQQMQEANADILLPVYMGRPGPIFLVKPSQEQMTFLSLTGKGQTVSVTDPGVVLTVQECSQALVKDHDRKLTRPELAFSIKRGKPLVDGKLMNLLFLIQENQSVREACSRMQISYSSAWNMLNAAEDALGYPLLLRNKGGPSGIGSLLTDQGEELLHAYTRFETAARENIEKLYTTYLHGII